jgi:hypothetical protein
MSKTIKLTPILAALLLGACTTMPSGPSVMALPGSGKNFDQFRGDDLMCRQYAQQQLGTSPESAAIDSGVRSAAVGTVIGAVAGAAINGGRGAGVGAGAGMALGGLSGVGAGNASAYNVQQRYDFGYQQCMYAQGHKIAVSGRFVSESRQSAQPPRGSSNYNPPPPDTAPPPGY